jgi:2-dehydropantoate 2-reductase
MRIAVVGVGAVGGYFGGRLAQAGLDVVFIARGKTLETLRVHGLHVRSVAGDFEINPLNVSDSPSAAGPCDVVLVAVKAHHVREIARTLAPLIGPETVVVPMQNGLEAPTLLAEALGPDLVVGGLCKIFASKTGAAAIEHTGLEPVIEFGELSGETSERVERIRAAFEPAIGMSTIVSDDVQTAMWQKLMHVEPLGAVGSVVREPAGVLCAIPETRRLLLTAMEEIVTLAAARGITIDPTLPERAVNRIDQLPPDTTASMHRDILAGLPSEFEFQTGTVVRYALESGVPAPVHSTIYAALLPGTLRAEGKLSD